MRNDNKNLLCELRKIDFALAETVLYLDAYPHTPEALSYYHKLKERRAELAEEYEKTYGPLTAMGNMSKNSWDWTNKPFPWEYEAN
jgi:spore coat protein JB